jgi:predicted extracellular nuclease
MLLTRSLSAFLFCLCFFLTFTLHATELSTPIASDSIDIKRMGTCGDTNTRDFKRITQIQGAFKSSSRKDSASKSSPNKRSNYINHWPSPLKGQWVVTEGVVTLDKSNDYQGFWLQQAAESSVKKTVKKTDKHTTKKRYKANVASSGIFVYHKSAKIQRGQTIRLLAQVDEYQGLTELKRVKAIGICAHNVKIPPAHELRLPVNSLAELEALEGMRVRINQNLKISDLYGAGYGLGNYGQFAISSQLHIQPTEIYHADALRSALLSKREQSKVEQSKEGQHFNKALDYLLVDDGFSQRSPAFIPFPNQHGFSAYNPLRIGDSIGPLTALLHSYGQHYILIPESLSDISIRVQARPKHPKVATDANVIFASMNVENYFNGDPSSSKNRDVGFPTARGAKTYQQFLLQTDKLVAALSVINADIIALMELENDGYGKYSAIAVLTQALNKRLLPAQQYRYIKPNRERLGRAAISVGLLYRHHAVEPIGTARVLDSVSSVKALPLDNDKQSSSKALFNEGYHRPSLLQSFKIKSSNSNQWFAVVVNHFKSKGRPCRGEKKDLLQGNCNLQRMQAASALVKFIDNEVSDNRPVLLLGDLNSYSQEDPLLLLAKAGFHNLNIVDKSHEGSAPQFFSYSYQGYLGNLDHALANKAMLPFIRSIDSWQINSVEDLLLRYDSRYAVPDAYRSSDHDPLVIGARF